MRKKNVQPFEDNTTVFYASDCEILKVLEAGHNEGFPLDALMKATWVRVNESAGVTFFGLTQSDATFKLRL